MGAPLSFDGRHLDGMIEEKSILGISGLGQVCDVTSAVYCIEVVQGDDERHEPAVLEYSLICVLSNSARMS